MLDSTRHIPLGKTSPGNWGYIMPTSGRILHSFIQNYLLSTFYVPGTTLRAVCTTGHKTGPYAHGFLSERCKINQQIYVSIVSSGDT